MVRLLEALASLVILTVLLALGLRVQHDGTLPVPGIGDLPSVLILPVLVALAILIVVITGHRWRRRAPAGVYTVLLVLPLAVGGAVRGWKTWTQVRDRIRVDDGYPHFFTRAKTELENHEFALRLLAAAIGDHTLATGEPPSDPAQVMVPAEWPLPEGFRFGIVAEGDRTVAVWSNRNGTTCQIGLGPHWQHASPGFGFTCHPFDSARPTSWGDVQREPAFERTDTFAKFPFSPWPQYRLDPLRTATVTGSSPSLPPPLWYVTIGGPARASPSVSGPLVLIGTHGTGVLEAHDQQTGDLVWRVREPNWIHQDAVSDGQRVFVGFGDNAKSFESTAPSGIAAHDVRTGRRTWTRFVDNSVMTSPVLTGSLVVFGSAKGDFWGLDKATGQPRWEVHLPGNLVMGPPLLMGDTVVVPLDPRGMCALLASTGETLWCTKLPRVGLRLGHISPAVAMNRVYGTFGVYPSSVGEMLWEYRQSSLSMLWSLMTTGVDPVETHQVTFALSLPTGALLWQSSLDESRCCKEAGQGGHMSGTPVPVVEDSTLLVVDPISNRLYRLDAMTGARLATSAPLGLYPRGPALVVDTTVIAADRNGILHVLDRDTLRERCPIPLGEPFDRTGPTLANGALILAGRAGGLYSIPLNDVLRCDPTLPDRIARLREAGT